MVEVLVMDALSERRIARCSLLKKETQARAVINDKTGQHQDVLALRGSEDMRTENRGFYGSTDRRQ